VDFHAYYQNLGLSASVVSELEEMRASAPVRNVGKRALAHLIADLNSRRNARPSLQESRTCEMLFALECELERSALSYVNQVAVKGVVRGKHISSLTADFLVYRTDGIAIVECKHLSEIETKASRDPLEWQLKDGTWCRPAVDRWAADRGLSYQIWSPPFPYQHYLANLELLYDALHDSEHAGHSRPMQQLLQVLQSHPLSISEALDSVDGLTGRMIVCALAHKDLHGLTRSVQISDFDTFKLFATKEHADAVDKENLRLLASKLEPLNAKSKLLNASRTDLERGERRLARVRRMLSGEEPITKKYKPLVRKVLLADEEGRSALEVCLTRYAACGRRVGQLTQLQESELAHAIVLYVSTPSIRHIRQAWNIMDDRCATLGIRTPCRTTLHDRITRDEAIAKALNSSGRRAFHALRPATPIPMRTAASQAYGLVAHIDSTKLDVRCIADFGPYTSKEAPTIYVAVDQATGHPLGRALVFGPSSRDALAVLMRDIVARNGFLPRYVILDRGSENTSHWFQDFCHATGVNRLIPPAGAPRHNSLVENILGRVNSQVAHLLKGSTSPDQKGRKVDGKFKSRRTAQHAFSTVVREVDAFLFEDVPDTPVGLRPGTPAEHMLDSIERLGRCGIPQSYDDAFLVLTSIPIEHDVSIDPTRGIRHLDRVYTSNELLAHANRSRPTDKRRDCIDPTRIYVKFENNWVSAFSSEAPGVALLGEEEKLFLTMSRAHVAKENRDKRAVVSRRRHDRILAANASAAAVSRPNGDEPRTPQPTSGPWIPADTPLPPFESLGE